MDDSSYHRPMTLGRNRTTVRGAHRARLEAVKVAQSRPNKTPAEETVLKMHERLRELEKLKPRAAKVAELHYFGGWKSAAISDELKIHEEVVGLELRLARAFISAGLASTKE